MYEFAIATDLPPNEVYKHHQFIQDVMYAGGHGLGKESDRTLWRSLPDTNRGGSVLIVRSTCRPLGQVASLEECTFKAEEGEIKKFICRLSLSKRVTVEDSSKPGGKRKVEQCLGEYEIADWLKRILENAGFELLNAALVNKERSRIKPGHFIDAGDIVFNARVTDSEVASRTYFHGIGRKKAFGMGLLIEDES